MLDRLFTSHLRRENWRSDERMAKRQRRGKGKGVDGMERDSFSSFIEQSFGIMKDLTQGSVTRHLLHMSAFLAVSMVVQTLYLLADLYWVGRLGKEAIAAVGVAGNITMGVLALTQMLGVGTTTLISQAAGRKDQQQAELVFNQSFVMSILIALAVGVVGFIVRPPYCDWLRADTETATLAKAYLLWILP